MILYMDSSAIVKRYVYERGSVEVQNAVEHANAIGTCVVSRPEVAATFRKAVRTRTITEADARTAFRRFSRGWPDLVRTRVTERLMKHAADLAWSHGLRGYDSVQLASAAAWQQSIGRHLTLATFDLRLWEAAQRIGLFVFPPNLPEWYAGI
jgi:uncharacterized protein